MNATGDEAFEATIGLELLVGTARLFRSLGHHDAAGGFRIDGVTGPDEYSAVADNNVYTNLMAQRNLRAAAQAAKRHPVQAHELGVDEEEMASWRDAAEAMFIPYDEALGVHPQNELFTSHEVWDFANTPPDKYPLLLHYPYFDLYRKQVVKQADLVLAMQMCPDVFTEEQMARNFAYYERLTVRDSSLSACTQSAVAAQVGHLRLAYDYLAEAALMDLADLEHNTRDGLHIASLTGAWNALVTGFGGMHRHNSTIGFAPRLPEGISRLAFTVTVRRRRLRVAGNRLLGELCARRGRSARDPALRHGGDRFDRAAAHPAGPEGADPPRSGAAAWARTHPAAAEGGAAASGHELVTSGSPAATEYLERMASCGWPSSAGTRAPCAGFVSPALESSWPRPPARPVARRPRPPHLRRRRTTEHTASAVKELQCRHDRRIGMIRAAAPRRISSDDCPDHITGRGADRFRACTHWSDSRGFRLRRLWQGAGLRQQDLALAPPHPPPLEPQHPNRPGRPSAARPSA